MTNREILSKLTNEEIAKKKKKMFCEMYACESCPLHYARLFGYDCGHKEIIDWLSKEYEEDGECE